MKVSGHQVKLNIYAHSNKVISDLKKDIMEKIAMYLNTNINTNTFFLNAFEILSNTLKRVNTPNTNT